MDQEVSDIAAAAWLKQFFGRVTPHLKGRRKDELFARYAVGVLGDGEELDDSVTDARDCPMRVPTDGQGEQRGVQQAFRHTLARGRHLVESVHRLQLAEQQLDVPRAPEFVMAPRSAEGEVI